MDFSIGLIYIAKNQYIVLMILIFSGIPRTERTMNDDQKIYDNKTAAERYICNYIVLLIHNGGSYVMQSLEFSRI